MKVLITGGKGQLGLALRNEIREKQYPWEIISTDHETLDITDRTQVEQMLRKHQPDIVINCAAYTAVDKCEEDVDKAYRINAMGVGNLATACESIGAKLVQVSTDYVFSGAYEEVGRPWREDDEVAPQNIYGSSKLMGEEMAKYCKRHFILRTAWLYGDGSNFVQTMLKLAESNRELNVVGDQVGNPTYAKDLATVIVDLMQTEYYGTYHATCEGTCSWYEVACKIFEIAKLDVQVNRVMSAEFVRPAKRPAYSSLDNEKIKMIGINPLREWEEALEEYLEMEKLKK
ncbi:MAG: dTDP-4-dehydrorhamnose reductase [Cellulosilyticaceae bacterium]